MCCCWCNNKDVRWCSLKGLRRRPAAYRLLFDNCAIIISLPRLQSHEQCRVVVRTHWAKKVWKIAQIVYGIADLMSLLFLNYTNEQFLMNVHTSIFFFLFLDHFAARRVCSSSTSSEWIKVHKKQVMN